MTKTCSLGALIFSLLLATSENNAKGFKMRIYWQSAGVLDVDGSGHGTTAEIRHHC